MTTAHIFSFNLLARAVSAAAATALVTACSGSGGGGSSAPLAEITSESVSAAIAAVPEAVSNCDSVDSSAVTTLSVASESSTAISGVLAVSRQVSSDGTVVTAMADTIGSCAGAPGVVSVDSEHVDGVTVYTMDFNAYCISGPEGDTIYTGTVTASENGTPTDDGPVISSLDLKANDLMVQPSGANGDTLYVSFDSHTDYGTEYGYFAGPQVEPDSDNPDVVNVGSFKVENETQAETYTIKDLKIERTGSLSSAGITINSGSYVNPEGEKVNLSTPEGEPLSVNGATGAFTGGTVVLTGSNDTQAEITAGTDRSVLISLGSDSVGGLDCSNTDAAASDTADIVTTELPVY